MRRSPGGRVGRRALLAALCAGALGLVGCGDGGGEPEIPADILADGVVQEPLDFEDLGVPGQLDDKSPGANLPPREGTSPAPTRD